MNLMVLLAQATAKTAEKAEVAETVEKIAPPVVDQALTSATIWTHILDADPLVKLTLVLLLGFSVACWAIIFFKWGQLKSALSNTQNFWNQFSNSTTLSGLSLKKNLQQGPLFELFESGLNNLSNIRKGSPNFGPLQRNVLVQKVQQVKEDKLQKLEQYVSFLATTASVAPFIGLFGTVWGILTAFMAIGKAGSTSLATVGPYIAEALVATAVGLFAAIPAVIAYNAFVGKINTIGKIMDLFVDDFVLKSEQEPAA